MQHWHMTKSIIISLGVELRHLSHFGHFNCLLCFNFFNRSGGVGSLGDSSSNRGPNPKSNDNGCERCRSEGGVIDHSLTPEPPISSSNSTSNRWCFGAIMGLGTKKKKKSQKNKGQVNSGHVQIEGADPDVLERLWKKRRKL